MKVQAALEAEINMREQANSGKAEIACKAGWCRDLVQLLVTICYLAETFIQSRHNPTGSRGPNVTDRQAGRQKKEKPKG